jgi:hypothetical protein
MASFPQVPHQKLVHPSLLLHSATYPAHLILLDFTTRPILDKEYRSLSSSLCNFLNSPVTSSLLGPNTLLNTLFSNTLSLCLPSVSVTKFVIFNYVSLFETFLILSRAERDVFINTHSPLCNYPLFFSDSKYA